MLTLFHHPFCPHSRFVRLALGEYGIAVRQVEERVWERREEFLTINPACTTPVLVEEGHPAIPGASIIAGRLGVLLNTGTSVMGWSKILGPQLGHTFCFPLGVRSTAPWQIHVLQMEQ